MVVLIDIFVSAVGPIIAIAGIGYLLAGVKGVDPEPLNTVAVYVLAPALVFHSLAVTELEGTTLTRITVGVVVFGATMWGVAEIVGRVAGTEEPLLSALLLVAIFANAGNLGIPVSDFAFGEVGRQTAALFLSVQAVLMYTAGVYIASRSGGSSGLEGAQRVFYIPLVYAVAAALVTRTLGIVPPANSAGMQTLQLVGESAIPVMLLLVGIQLARTDADVAVSGTGIGAALRLGFAPLVGLAVALAIGFDDPTVGRVFVLVTAMPAAVTPLILVMEFAADSRSKGVSVPEFVSTCVLVTTLLSIPILTILIAILRSGVII